MNRQLVHMLSWLMRKTLWSNKYNVYSINTRKEIENIKDIYPNVIFIETNDTFNYNGKKLPKYTGNQSTNQKLAKNRAVNLYDSIIQNNEIDNDNITNPNQNNSNIDLSTFLDNYLVKYI